jgi:hypothetical protein
MSGTTTQGTDESAVSAAVVSAFDPETGQWELAWPGCIAQYDLVYDSPPADPLQGFALGNGDIGVICWTAGSRVYFAINKCDLWDEASFEHFTNWQADQEDRNTTLRHACRVILDFNQPLFDLMYLTGCAGRLSLADAGLHLAVETPLGTAEIRAFVAAESSVLCIDVRSTGADDIPLDITVERYGSRTFAHWYAQINRDASIGLDGTQSHLLPEGALITHIVTSGRFAAGLQIVPRQGESCHGHRLHPHAAQVRVTGTPAKRITVYAGVTSPCAHDPVTVLTETLASAASCGMDTLYHHHQAVWQSFWLRSFMQFGDRYLDNLWHLAMYYARASQGGAYPGRFIHGLWGWNRDVQPWNFYFHWNQQELYWPLNAAGHHDLLDPYLAYRFASLPNAMQDAEQHCGVQGGAIVSDVCDAFGRNSTGELDNHTPVAQIALDFWRQYRYTGDRQFLQACVVPYLTAAAVFFGTLFERGEDGLYHARRGTAYEGWIPLRDVITELACARALFAATLSALDDAGITDPRAETWRELLEYLAPFPRISSLGQFVERQGDRIMLTRGIFAGDIVPTETLLAAGYSLDDASTVTSRIAQETPPALAKLNTYEMMCALETNAPPYSSSHGSDYTLMHGLFPSAEASVVFPANLVSIADRGTALYDSAITTMKAFAPECMGWDPLPIALARLGCAEETYTILTRWPARWQFYCNGWTQYGPQDVMKADAAFAFRVSRVRDCAQADTRTFRDVTEVEDQQRDARFLWPQWPFRHMGMEPLSVLACTMNECLLHSHEGIMRVAPAVPPHLHCRFTLHAMGGFLVSAEIKDAAPAWIHIHSLRGGRCRIENPWACAYLHLVDRTDISSCDTVVTCELQPGESCLLSPNPGVLAAWRLQPESPAPNDHPLTDASGGASLGLPRMF